MPPASNLSPPAPPPSCWPACLPAPGAAERRCVQPVLDSPPPLLLACLSACLPQVLLSGGVSSQYLTALLMAAPLATGSEGIEIVIKDELVSQPYVDMTVKLMERFGVVVQRLDGLRHMKVGF